MANKVGQLKCSFNSKNSGYGSCIEEWKQIAGALIYDKPRTFTDDEIKELQETLANDAINDSKSLRMYPVHNFVDITDNSEAPVIESFGYGPKAIVRDGDYDWTFPFTDGANCVQQAMRTHNGKRYVLFYDKDNKILGYNKNGFMATIPLQFFYAQPWKAATGTTSAKYLLQFVFLAKYINESRAFVKVDFDVSEITGLQDIDIVLNSFNENTGVANVTLQTSCGAENLYDEFHAQLALTANFKAMDDDGNPITVSTVAGVAGNKTFNITLATGSFPDDGNITLYGAAVSVTTGNNVPGYEIGSVELELAGS